MFKPQDIRSYCKIMPSTRSSPSTRNRQKKTGSPCRSLSRWMTAGDPGNGILCSDRKSAGECGGCVCRHRCGNPAFHPAPCGPDRLLHAFHHRRQYKLRKPELVRDKLLSTKHSGYGIGTESIRMIAERYPRGCAFCVERRYFLCVDHVKSVNYPPLNFEEI